MEIKRYNINFGAYYNSTYWEHPKGIWVKYSDMEKIVEENEKLKKENKALSEALYQASAEVGYID